MYSKNERGISLLTLLAVLVAVALMTWGKVSYDNKQKARVAAEQIQAKIDEETKAKEQEKAKELEKTKELDIRKKNLETQITQKISSSLKDPASAQFRNIKVLLDRKYQENLSTDVVCGDVNAKNSYGGYTGFTSFVWVSHSDLMLIRSLGTSDDDKMMNALIDVAILKNCSSDP